MAVINLSITIPNDQMPRVLQSFRGNDGPITVPDLTEILRLGVIHHIKNTVRDRGRQRDIDKAQRDLQQARRAAYDVDAT